MSGFYQLDFEKDVRALEQRLAEARRELEALRKRAHDRGGGQPSPFPALDEQDEDPADARSLERTIDRLEQERERTIREVYADLDPWQVVRVARHPDRPQTRDYIAMICRDFCELHGDRRFGDDPAIVTGLARLGPHKVMVVGHQKGRTTQEKLACHFGCAHPEGYRKALLKMRLAEKMGIPIVTLVDTPGAYPGIGAEQRGQAEAIAVNLREMSRIRVPIVSVIIGEGGSGGALGIAVANRVAMMRYAWYSVISPEGCAAILWKQANEQTNQAAAKALKLSATDNLNLGIIDAIIDEPLGGAHRDPAQAGRALETWISEQIEALGSLSPDELVEDRYRRFRRLGSVVEQTPAASEQGVEAGMAGGSQA